MMAAVTETKPRRRRNLADKRALETAALHHFVRKYARKVQKGLDPNDRKYDRKVQHAVKRMKPETLDRLLHGDEIESRPREEVRQQTKLP